MAHYIINTVLFLIAFGNNTTYYDMYLPYIGIYGDLTLYGKSHNHMWTKLSATSNAGSKVLQLESAVDWEAGMEVAVTPTGYEMDETEICTIAEVGDGGKKITLTRRLAHKHLGKVILFLCARSILACKFNIVIS